MKKYSLLGFSLTIAALACLMPAYGKAPVEIDQVASVEDLAMESEARLSDLRELLVSEDGFEDSIKKVIPNTAGTLACMAQAIAEHTQQDKVKIAAADLRDAALKIAASKTYDEAVAALKIAQDAFNGNGNGQASAEYPWDKLIPLQQMMQEVNTRNSQLRRAVRRSRDPQQDSLHATTLAVLAVAMHADTHALDSDEDRARWQSYSADMQATMSELAAALKKQDDEAAKEVYLRSLNSCKSCHEAYRAE